MLEKLISVFGDALDSLGDQYYQQSLSLEYAQDRLFLLKDADDALKAKEAADLAAAWEARRPPPREGFQRVMTDRGGIDFNAGAIAKIVAAGLDPTAKLLLADVNEAFTASPQPPPAPQG